VEPNLATNGKLDARNLKLLDSSLMNHHGKCSKETYQVPKNWSAPRKLFHMFSGCRSVFERVSTDATPKGESHADSHIKSHITAP
jgi:hypothetical protein